MLLRCGLFYAGALLYTLLLKDGGAAGAVFVTTTRKALTVIISFLAFPKPFSSNYAIGGGLLLGAIYCEYVGGRVQPTHSQPKHEHVLRTCELAS